MTNIKEDLVSVIIPTHNRAEMLGRAVRSVLNQAYENLEIIIVADCCTDNTEEVIRSFKDGRIVFIDSQKPLGGAGARNIGLDHAGGKFIAFLDDDDEWLDGKITAQMSAFAAYQDVAIVSCDYFRFDGRKDLRIGSFSGPIVLNDLLYENYCGSFSFCMVRKKCLNGSRINLKLKAGQDWDLWIKILRTSGLTARAVRKPLVRYYNDHKAKLTRDSYNRVTSHIVFLRYYWPLLSSEQRNYHLYRRCKLRKRYLEKENYSYIYNLLLSRKAFIHYRKSRYKLNVRSYFKLLLQILPFRRWLLIHKPYLHCHFYRKS